MIAGAKWNGQPAECRRVMVVVADNGRFPNYWARVAGMVGEEVEALEVIRPGQEPFYILNDEGQGVAKVVIGGGPLAGHRTLEIEKVTKEITS